MSGSANGAIVGAESRLKVLGEHLLTWLIPFHQEVEKAARHPAFAALASLLLSIVQADQREVGPSKAN